MHGLATAAGCQLVASADLAVASEDAAFAAPGGKGGWFCHTPMVAIARNVGRKRAAEMALSGDIIDARSALDWGLVNRVVPADQLDSAIYDLLKRVTSGSAQSKGIGKQALYAQIDLDQQKAYAYAIEVMAATSQLPDARESMRAFLDKRKPHWQRHLALPSRGRVSAVTRPAAGSCPRPRRPPQSGPPRTCSPMPDWNWPNAPSCAQRVLLALDHRDVHEAHPVVEAEGRITHDLRARWSASSANTLRIRRSFSSAQLGLRGVPDDLRHGHGLPPR